MRNAQLKDAGMRRRTTLEAAAACAVVCLVGLVLSPTVQRVRARASALRRAERLHASLRDGSPRRASRAEGRGPLAAAERLGTPLASWGNIGGCGVGGGGGGGGGVRWIGRRAPAGGIEVEVLDSQSDGEDLSSNTLTLKVSKDVPGRLNVSLNIPRVSNVRSVDPAESGGVSEVAPEGLGDMSLSVSRKFGMEGDTTLNLTLGLPTGHYKIYDGNKTPVFYYPSDAQPGRGVYTTSMQFEKSLDRDWGPMIVGGSYSYNGGENDIGNMKGDTLSAYWYAGFRTETFVHSVGVNLSLALDKDKELGGEIDDQSDLLLSLQYGIEYSSGRVPVFAALATTLNDSGTQEAFTLALGMVTSF